MGVAVTIKIKSKYYTHDCSRDLKEDAFRADPVPKANLIDDLTSGPHLTKWGVRGEGLKSPSHSRASDRLPTESAYW